MFLLFITHSPSPGILKGPQWMNKPNFASLNHSLAFRFSEEGVYDCADKLLKKVKLKIIE